MNETVLEQYPIILQVVDEKLHDQYSISYEIHPWNIKWIKEHYSSWEQIKDFDKESQSEIKHIVDCLESIFDDIARLEGERWDWCVTRHKRMREPDCDPELLEKELPERGYSFPEDKHFWIDWIKLSKGTYRGERHDCIGYLLQDDRFLQSGVFKAWEPFFKMYKINNDQLLRWVMKYQNLNIFDTDTHPEDCNENWDSFLFNSSGGFAITTFLQQLKWYGYTREQAWSFFEPEEGFFAYFYTHYAYLPTDKLAKHYRERVIKSIFDEEFPPQKKKRTKKGEVTNDNSQAS